MATTKNIYQRIAAVMEEVKYVQKTGYNGFHKYKYAKESDYIESIRPMLLKHGLIVLTSTESVSTVGELTSVTIKYTLVNIDNPSEKIESIIPGAGSDKGDKGVYKALTGSKKYFIGMTFLIETGDDAEADESTDVRAAARKTETSGYIAPVAAAKSELPAAASTTVVVTNTAAPVAAEAPKKNSWRKVGQAPLANGHAKPAAKSDNDLDL